MSVPVIDDRHRVVFNAVYETGTHHNGVVGALISDWTFAPLIEFAAGRPFNIITGSDQNFDFGSTTDRPSVAHAGETNACGAAIASKYSPTGYLIQPCYLDVFLDGGVPPVLAGTLGRNAGTKPWNVFDDLRVSRRFSLSERIKLDGIMDAYETFANAAQIWTQAGIPTASFDPRQFQFALKLSW